VSGPRRITDPRDFGRVAVLMGGSSSERDVSLDSGSNVLEALKRRGVDAVSIDGIPALVAALALEIGSEPISSTGGSKPILRRRGSRKPGPGEIGSEPISIDRVFNILHGNRGGGEDGVVQGMLEAFGVPYTGSGVLGSALSMDKIRTKQVWLALGLPTPAYAQLERGDDVIAAARRVGLPVIVKPACEGSSVGVTRCFRDADLPAAVALASRYDGPMLVERLIEGEEYTVGVLGADALPSIRIVPAGEYYDYHAKYVATDTQYICPGLTGSAEQELGALALSAFFAAGCSGWGRVDFMRDHGGHSWLLEVNTAPGMTSHSLVPKAAHARGIDFDELVWRVLETSFAARGP
jgi:D-alanine-D-alanine ligase